MARPAEKLQERFTYADYLQWNDGERWELIDGVPYNMTAAPFRLHQGIVGELFRQIANFLDDKPCEVYAAPFDVRLPKTKRDKAHKRIYDVVQPDIAVICDPEKLDDAGCIGAPDVIIEVLSPSTAGKDQIKKAALYEKHGVKEYWIVHPTDKIVMVRILDEHGKYGMPVFYEGQGKLMMVTLPGLEIDLDKVFHDKFNEEGRV
jgi:Uma2 family endonuclease